MVFDWVIKTSGNHDNTSETLVIAKQKEVLLKNTSQNAKDCGSCASERPRYIVIPFGVADMKNKSPGTTLFEDNILKLNIQDKSQYVKQNDREDSLINSLTTLNENSYPFSFNIYQKNSKNFNFLQ